MHARDDLSAYPPDRLTAVVLGADAGGSHSTVAMGREDGTVLGRAEGPGAAMRPGGAAASAVVLVDTARRAATQAGVSLPVHRAVGGAAGAGRAQEQRELASALVAAGIARAARLLAGHVLNAAREGEAVALRILRDAAGELAALVRALERFFPGAGDIPVALAGGLLFATSPLAAVLRQTLAAEMPRARLRTGPVDTAVGALQLAALG